MATKVSPKSPKPPTRQVKPSPTPKVQWRVTRTKMPSPGCIRRGQTVYLAKLCKQGKMELAVAYAGLKGLPMPAWAEAHRGQPIEHLNATASAAHNSHYVNHPTSNPLGGRGLQRELAGNGNESASGDKNKIDSPPNKNSVVGDGPQEDKPEYLRMGDKVHLHDGSEAILLPYPRGPLEDGVSRLITAAGGAVGATSLMAGRTPAEVKEEQERVHAEEVEWCRANIPVFKPAREVLPVGVRWCQVVGAAMNPMLKRVRFEDNGKEEGLWVTGRQNLRRMVERGKWVAAVWDDERENGKGGWKLWVR